MRGFWILFCATFLTGSFAVNTDFVELMYGNQLTIKMPVTRSDTLEFTNVDETQHYTVFSRGHIHQRGSVVGSGDDRRYIIRSVNFDDQGTYTQQNFWRKLTYITKLKVSPKRQKTNCVAGETLSISLQDIRKDEASLMFSTQDENVMLVRRGEPLRTVSDFFERIKVTSSRIDVLNVNVSDVGNYTLYDGQDRTAVIVFLNLVDHHEGISAGPLMSLLLLLGIPAGVCCCCRKRIFKNNSRSTAMTVTQVENFVAPPGPPPAYNNPVPLAGPDPMCTPGYPTAGNGPIPPPAGSSYPVQPQYSGQPAFPANPDPNCPPAFGCPPAQPPQWTGPPYNPPAPAMYTPGYPAPGDSNVHPPLSDPAYPPQPQYGGQPAAPLNPGFAPVMYSEPAGSENVANKGDIKMNELSSATPLLGPSHPEVGPPPASYTGTDILNSSSQFNTDTAKSSGYNFL